MSISEPVDNILFKFFTGIFEIIKIVEDISYKDIALGRDIFIVHYIGVKEKRDEKCQIKTVMDYFAMTPSTATRHIDSLVKSGIIIRDEDKAKRSSKILRLSPLGEEIYEMFENHQIDFTKRLSDEFTDHEIITIHRLLNWIIKIKHLIFNF
ncbi:MAG: MarR family winged helix-turn-helix transcriptional regulator [Candidatus Thorarchaeota archaeon]